MKKSTSIILYAILFVAVIVLFILSFSSNGKKENVVKSETTKGQLTDMKIAYIKTDSLIINYELAQDLHDEFTKNQESFTKEYSDKRSNFEKQAADFQAKVKRGGFLTEDRAVQERDRLSGEQQKIVNLDQELSKRLSDIQNANSQQLMDSLMNYLKEYNSEKKYDYIFNASSILIGDETQNITKEVLDALNSRYPKKKNSSKK